MKRFIFCTFLFFGFYFLFAIPPRANAAENISVTPQILRIDLATDQPFAVYTYKNNTRDTIELSLTLQDFKDLGDQGTPVFFAPNEDGSYKYGLASWATLSTQDIVIAPNDSQDVKVFIEKEKLTLGGHYAAILAELKQGAGGKRNVQLKALLAALLFVRSGAEFDREDGKIETLDAENSLFSFPDSFTLRFQNTGNVDVTPYGLLVVKDMFGKTVAKGVVNENSLISLPESIRRYGVPVLPESKFILPGIYKAHLALHFGEKRKDLTGDLTFFSLGSFGTGIIILVVVILAIFGFIRFKRSEKNSNLQSD